MPAGVKPGQNYRITDLDLASRLSFFIWSTVPDAELLKVATDNTLHTAGGARQAGAPDARRSAAPRRCRRASRRSGCGCRTSRRFTPTRCCSRRSTTSLAESYKRETELFFDSIVREDRSVLDLFTADYTFVNERIAKRLPDSEHHRRERSSASAVTDENRRGILGHGSILMHDVGGRPHVAGAARQVDHGSAARVAAAAAAAGRRRRSRTPSRRPIPASRCRRASAWKSTARTRRAQSCHRVIDPLGLALENFDVVGAWRIKDNGVGVDYRGEALRRHRS